MAAIPPGLTTRLISITALSALRTKLMISADYGRPGCLGLWAGRRATVAPAQVGRHSRRPDGLPTNAFWREWCGPDSGRGAAYRGRLSGSTAARVPPTNSDALHEVRRAQGAVAATLRSFADAPRRRNVLVGARASANEIDGLHPRLSKPKPTARHGTQHIRAPAPQSPFGSRTAL